MPKRNSNNEIIFSDYAEFRPNLTPREMFQMGSFGGTYWRPIHSGVTNKNYKNVHQKYPKSWWSGIPDDWLTLPFDEYDKSINKYNVKVGTTLEFWEKNGWITKYHQYGWVHWYCDFYQGKRCPDDERQIKRWSEICGENGRFRKWLITQIINKKSTWNDNTISPKIRQTLQHWGYKLSKKDFDNEKKNREK